MVCDKFHVLFAKMDGWVVLRKWLSGMGFGVREFFRNPAGEVVPGMVACFLLIFSTLSCASLSVKGEMMVAERKMTVWQLVGELGNEMPLSRSKIESKFGVKLSEMVRDEYKTHLAGADVSLAEKVRIERIDLVLGPTEDFDVSSALSLELGGVHNVERSTSAVWISASCTGPSGPFDARDNSV